MYVWSGEREEKQSENHNCGSVIWRVVLARRNCISHPLRCKTGTELLLCIKKSFPTSTAVGQWNRLPWKELNFPSEEVFYPKLAAANWDIVKGHPAQGVRWDSEDSFQSLCCCSVTNLCLILYNPQDCSTQGFPVLHYLLEFSQTHVHWVGDAIQPSHPLSPLLWPSIFPSIRVFSAVSALRIRWPKYWHQSFQWIFRVDFL